MSVGAKHLEDKLSVIAKNSSPNASPVQLSVVSCSLSVVRCPLSVGAKHLEDKLSVIAKNSSPNASPVQLSVVRCSLSVVSCSLSVVSRGEAFGR
ncbi:hypothetical protein FJR09_05780 [Dolichospermum sp. UHCC 0406]|nr:hypothetical protein [Dolichospermum sp. UHCC 0406]